MASKDEGGFLRVELRNFARTTRVSAKQVRREVLTFKLSSYLLDGDEPSLDTRSDAPRLRRRSIAGGPEKQSDADVFLAVSMCRDGLTSEYGREGFYSSIGFGHNADMLNALTNVCLWGNRGHRVTSRHVD